MVYKIVVNSAWYSPGSTGDPASKWSDEQPRVFFVCGQNIEAAVLKVRNIRGPQDTRFEIQSVELTEAEQVIE